MRHTILLAAVLLPLAAAAPALRAQLPGDTVVRGPDDTEAQRIFTSLMSPYCPGLTVAACPSPGAEAIRQSVRARLARGDTRAAIVDSLVAVYGEQLLGAPPARRWGLALWVPPAVILLAGGTFLTLWLRRRGAPREAAPSIVTATDPADRARLEAALRDFDRDA
jgi:cytochrome c-type biogenesis protein CcmH